jgi:hypothetical protein
MSVTKIQEPGMLRPCIALVSRAIKEEEEDHVEKRKFLNPPGLELRPLGRPAMPPTLSRL